jgi:hypothetical protein
MPGVRPEEEAVHRQRLPLWLQWSFFFVCLSAATNLSAAPQSFSWIDAQGAPVTVLFEGSLAGLRAVAPDANTDPFTIEAITVEVSAARTGDVETLSLTETGPDTGTFEGAIRLDLSGAVPNGTLGTGIDIWSYPIWDTVTADYDGATATATTLGSTAEFLDAQGNPATTYAIGATIHLRVRDHLADTSPAVDSTTAYVFSSLNYQADSEQVTLIETGGGTGVFEGSIATVALPPYATPLSNSGVIDAAPNAELGAVHEAADGATSSEDHARAVLDLPASIEILTSNGQPLTEALHFSSVNLRVKDGAAAGHGTITAEVSSLLRGDTRTLTLFEDASEPGVFNRPLSLQARGANDPPSSYGLDVTEDLGPPHRDDTVRATFACSAPPCPEATVGTTASRIRLLDMNGIPVTRVQPGQPIWLELTDWSERTPMDYTLETQPGGDFETIHLSNSYGSGLYITDFTLEEGPAVPGDYHIQVDGAGTLVVRHDNLLGSITTVSVPVDSTMLEFLDRQGNPASFLWIFAPVRVRATYTAGNTSPGGIDTVTATVVSRDVYGTVRDTEPLQLVETGADTGVFTGQLPTAASSLGQAGNGSLETFATDGRTIDKVVVSLGDQTAAADIEEGRLQLVNAAGADAPQFAVGQTIHARLEGDVYNYDPTTVQTTYLRLTSQSTGDLEYMVLTETGNDTSVFTGSLPTGGDGRVPYRLDVQEGETVKAEVYSYLIPVTDQAVITTNQPPLAQPDTATGPEDTQEIVIPVLANDSDPEGGALTIHGILLSPSQGSILDSGDGTIHYQPYPNAYGTDSFRYEVADEAGALSSAEVTVTLTPSPDPPQVSDGMWVEVTEDTPRVFWINVTDPDGDQVTLTAMSGPEDGVLAGNPDGSSTYTPAPNATGARHITYTYTDSTGLSATGSSILYIYGVNDPPTAVDDSYTLQEDHFSLYTVTTNDYDVDGEAPRVTAVSTPAHGTATGGGSPGRVLYTPAANYNGPDSFTYTLTDAAGATSTATVHITVTSVPDLPVAVADSATTPEDTPISLAVLANDSDGDGDPLTITYDGTQPSHGVVAFGDPGILIYRPRLNYSGPDSFTYVITDGTTTATATVTLTVTPVNDPPVATNDVLFFDEDTVGTLPVLANDSDVEGNTLTITAITQGAHGVAVIRTGTPLMYIEFTPVANYAGSDTLTYTISDGKGGTATATVNLVVRQVPDPPVAVNDAAATNEDTAVTVNVLANDFDVDNNTLSVANIIAQPAHGAAVRNPNNTITYTPAANYNGSDSFTYNLADGTGRFATGTVNVTIAAVNDPPVAVNDSVTIAEDGTIAISVLANDSDPDGDTLSVTAFTQGAHGAVSRSGNVLTYVPAADWSGSDSFSYTVGDGKGGTATAAVAVTITAVNDPPVAVNDSVTIAEDGSIVIPVLANDHDAEGALGLSSLVAYSMHGDLEVLADGTVRYTPYADYNGSDSFTYRVTDGGGLTADATVAVTVAQVPDPPHVGGGEIFVVSEDYEKYIPLAVWDTDGGQVTLQSMSGPADGTLVPYPPGQVLTFWYTPAANANGDRPFTYTYVGSTGLTATATSIIRILPVNDPPVVVADSATTPEDTAMLISVAQNDSEVDGEALILQSVTQPAHGIASVVSGNRVSYTPAANYNGPDSFTYRMADTSGLTATATVTVTVTPVADAPVAVNDTVTTPEDTAVAIAARANDSDPDGDTLTITAVTQPAHGAATFSAASLTYTPAANYNGADSFTYTISDGNGGTATATVNVNVTSVNDAPIATNDSASTAEDAATTISVLTNDTDLDGDSLAVTAVTQPVHGTASFTAGGVTYTPAANYNGLDSFTYTISDSHGGSATAGVNVTVTAANDAPTAVNDSASTAEDAATTVSVLTNDTDLDGDSLSVTTVTQPAHGSASRTASSVTYTPAANYNGSDSFTYTISDGNGGTATATVNVTVTAVNDTPTAVNDSASTAEDAATTISVLNNDTDLDGDSLSVTAVTQPAHGSASRTVSSVTYTPAANYNGSDSFTYTISDGNGGSATATVNLTVTAVNDPPAAGNDVGTTREGVAVTVSVLTNDSDVEGSALTVTAVSTPAHGTVTRTASTVTYTPATNFNGTDTFTYTLSDGTATTTATVTITVKDSLERVAVLAINSAYIQTGADVLSGDVIVNQAGAGPFLNGGVELSIAGTLTTPSGWDVEADSITIAAGTTVASDAFFNQLNNSGSITGQQTSILTLPVFAALPAFLTATPNTTDVSVGANGSRMLAPGTYRDLIVGKKGTVIFSGGTYHFRSITTDTQAKLLFSAASTVRVQQRLSVKATSTVGPNTGASVTAAGIVFYVAGVNGTGGGIAETPRTVEIAADNVLTANVYAPNGTLWLGDRTQARGSFLAKDVHVAPDVQVTLQTAWTGQ